MKKQSIIFAFLAITFGVIIFLSSLLTYSQNQTMGSERVSHKKLYFCDKILPDHIFYPALMAVDKTLISISGGDAKVFLRIKMAQDRMISAKKLLEKGEELLALSTITKSQKYLILATQELFSQENYSKETVKALYMALNENTNNLSTIEKDFKTIPTGPINDLITESQSLLVIIESKIR